MKNWKMGRGKSLAASFVMAFAMAFAMSSVISHSNTARADDTTPIYRPGGGGHDVPSPLLAQANTKVELADGEIYQVIGRVVFDDDQVPYIRVDLNKMPWLASAARKAFPLYRLEGESSFWRKYEDTRIKFTCEAHGQIIESGNKVGFRITLGAILGDKYRIEKP